MPEYAPVDHNADILQFHDEFSFNIKFYSLVT